MNVWQTNLLGQVSSAGVIIIFNYHLFYSLWLIIVCAYTTALYGQNAVTCIVSSCFNIPTQSCLFFYASWAELLHYPIMHFIPLDWFFSLHFPLFCLVKLQLLAQFPVKHLPQSSKSIFDCFLDQTTKFSYYVFHSIWQILLFCICLWSVCSKRNCLHCSWWNTFFTHFCNLLALIFTYHIDYVIDRHYYYYYCYYSGKKNPKKRTTPQMKMKIIFFSVFHLNLNSSSLFSFFISQLPVEVIKAEIKLPWF